jgi:hypothetical protein
MGQYYKIVNLRDKQYLHPHHCGDGLKLMEFGMSGAGTLSVLAAAIANTREHKGSWAGASLVIAGDYADNGRFVPEDMPDAQDINLYEYVDSEGTPYVNASQAYAELAEHALSVEVRADIPWGDKSGKCPRFFERLAARKKLVNLEELFEMLDEALEPDDATSCAGNLLRGLRVASVKSNMAWHRAQGQWIEGWNGTAHLRITLEASGAEPSSAQHAGEVLDLVFPMTAARLAKKLGFLDHWREHYPRAMSTKTAKNVAADAEQALGLAPAGNPASTPR